MTTFSATSPTISEASYGSVRHTSVSTEHILVSDQDKIETAHWEEAIDQILKFKSDTDFLDQNDVPSDAAYQAAIDFAVDHKDLETRAPSWIVPSGSGRIVFEWHVGDSKFLLEFVEEGFAKYIELHRGKVVNRGFMHRNPISRKLELKYSS